MDKFEYFFKSKYLKIKLHDMKNNPCSISKLFGSKYSNNLKQKLNGVSIIDDKEICKAIVDCMPIPFSIAHTVKLVPYHLYGAGLSYYIYNMFAKKNVYRITLYICDPNIDVSFLLN